MLNDVTTVDLKKQKKKDGKSVQIWKRYKKSKLAMLGLIIMVFLIIIALLAPIIADYETKVIHQDHTNTLQGPSSEHWFGTDGYGRDVFARVVHGTRISLFIGIFSTAVCLIVGGILGAIAGYYGGRIDEIIMRLLDTIMSIPSILLSLAVVGALGAGLRNLIIAITISRTPQFTRIIRSSILTVVGEEYIEAAKSIGASEVRIISLHVLPNAMGPIIVQATMSVAQLILTAASLSFMGMGVIPPSPEWGLSLIHI